MTDSASAAPSAAITYSGVRITSGKSAVIPQASLLFGSRAMDIEVDLQLRLNRQTGDKRKQKHIERISDEYTGVTSTKRACWKTRFYERKGTAIWNPTARRCFWQIENERVEKT
jgi:hypothetical protein